MSVYTKVTERELGGWLTAYSVGTLVELKGIAAGIENTNYFVTTTHGRYVLTLFERLPAKDLPFYLGLMAHLARHGIPCPSPLADRSNRLLSELNGKPAALVTRLPGAVVAQPSAAHCAEVGAVLANMHVAGQSYAGDLENPRGPKWWRETAREVLPFLALQRLEVEFPATIDIDAAFERVLHLGMDRFGSNIRVDRVDRNRRVVVLYRFSALGEELDRIHGRCRAEAIARWCSAEGMDLAVCTLPETERDARVKTRALSLRTQQLLNERGGVSSYYLERRRQADRMRRIRSRV